VSVSVQLEQGGIWIPVGGVVPTSGLTSIRLDLTPPHIATALSLRIFRPNDSHSVGLAHLKVMGSSVFGGAGVKDPFSGRASKRW
jgi:hypothetical protein